MRAVVQRVQKASVSVDDKIVGKINYGYMILVGFTYGDNDTNIEAMVKKILNLRIMDDENGVIYFQYHNLLYMEMLEKVIVQVILKL